MPKKIYKTKINPADKKQTISSISELTDAVIHLLDRQDKYDDAILKLQHKQERLQATFDNLIAILNLSQNDIQNIKKNELNLTHIQSQIDTLKNVTSNICDINRSHSLRLEKLYSPTTLFHKEINDINSTLSIHDKYIENLSNKINE